MNKTTLKTRILVECAILIAMGTILAQIKLFRLPAGGSVTAASMVPFILISFRHGTKWGIIAGVVNTLLQIAIGGIYTPPAGTVWAVIGSILLDYAIAYICLGFSKAFSKPFKNKTLGVAFGTFMVCFIRFLCSFVSGFLIWASLVEDGFGAITYSLTYNGSYMLPETLITIVVIVVLYRTAPKIFKGLE